MPNAAPQHLVDGPPTEVQVFVLPAVPGGCHSLLCYPRRRGDNKIFFTHRGQSETPGLAREVVWIPNGLLPGQVLLIQEKATGPSQGHFPNQPFRILPADPYKPSGPATKDARHGRVSTWEYEITLSDATGVLARLDPDVIIITEP